MAVTSAVNKKKWIYVINFVGLRQENEVYGGAFEATKISPYLFPEGHFFADDEAPNYDNANPMQLWDYIRNIGDRDTLAVKKVTDINTVYLQNAFQGDLELNTVSLSVAATSSIPHRVRGNARLELARIRALTTFLCQSPSIIYCQAGIAAGNQRFDYISFKLAEFIQYFSN